MANLKKSRIETKTRVLPERPLVALFCRNSSDKQAKEMTIDRQVSLTNEIYERHFSDNPDAKLVGLFKDEGYNLEKEDPKRNFWKIISLIKSKQVNTIIVASDDRIFRGESGELRGKITDVFRKHRIRLITSSSSMVYDPSETSSRIASSVTQELGAIAKLESMKTLQDGRRRKMSEKGDWFLNVTPYGIRCERYLDGKVKKYRYYIVEEEARYIRDIFRLYVGEPPEILPKPTGNRRIGACKIAQILEAANVCREAWVKDQPPNIGTLGWDKQKVLRIITNETYTGRLVVNFQPTDKISGFDRTRTVGVIDIPAIVDDRLFYAAQNVHGKIRNKLLDDRQSRTETNWLHGAVACPVCGSKLTGRIANRNHRYYGCEGFHGLYRADDLESIVENLLKRIILNPKNFEDLLRLANDRGRAANELATLNKLIEKKEREKAEMESKLDALLEKNLTGLVSDEQYHRVKDKMLATEQRLETEIKHCQAELKGLAEINVNISSLEQVRDALESALKKPDIKPKILRLALNTFFSDLRIVPDPVDTTGLSEAEIGTLYQEGRLTLKHLKEALGWTPKKIYSRFGQTNRKIAIDYKVDYKLFKSQKPHLTIQ